MLTLADTIVLPAGVRAEPGALADDVRAARFPVNETATLVVARCGRPLQESALELARRHGVDPLRVSDDVLRFAHALNGELLVNVRRGGGRLQRAGAWVVLAVRLAPAGSVPAAIARRHPLSTASAWRAALGAARALVPRSIVVVVAATVVVAPAAASTGPLALPVGVAAGLVLHEAGHAAALTGIDAALVTAGMRTFVIHRPLAPRRRGIVAGAGPAAAAAAGVLAATAAWLVATPELALAACPLATHAIGLTVATGDGRAACGL